jgi:16S rRNA (cytidine1402-2'-O)-methyltransferase
MTGKLYLIPNLLGESCINHVLPTHNNEIINNIKHFIVEDIRTTRRFLKKVNKDIDIDKLTFFELNQHTNPQNISSYIAPLLKGNDMAIISEAGCPAVADPCALVVELAQQKNIRVIPLVGPSSILMAVMASGLSGQSFAFNGYLPIKEPERSKTIKRLESRARTEHQSQLFIEAPYRNVKLLEQMLKSLNPDTRLCIACDITSKSEYIRTQSVAQWRKTSMPDIQKRPTIFIIG